MVLKPLLFLLCLMFPCFGFAEELILLDYGYFKINFSCEKTGAVSFYYKAD
jgi:hypothetical protein